MKLLFLSGSVAALAAMLLLTSPAFHPSSAAAAVAVPAVKAPPDLSPHKAIYQLNLIRTTPRDGVRAVRGSMIYTLADRCDGYTVESNISMNMTFSDGEAQDIDQRYAAWEAKDGRFSSFTMQTLENGKAQKTYRGTITLAADGSGQARYEGAETKDFDLDAGTMLSTAHTVALIQHAAAGKKFFSGQVIDGSFDRGPFVVSAAIAPPRTAKVLFDREGTRDLSGGRYWPTSMAYFPVTSSETLPEYELNMELLPSGVSRSMEQDFGTFTVGFTLIDIEPGEKSGCE